MQNIIEHTFSHSSSLCSCQYSRENGILQITFHGGGSYKYHNVPCSVFEGLVNADSAGRFFHRWIRGVYENPLSLLHSISPTPPTAQWSPSTPTQSDRFYDMSEAKPVNHSMPCYQRYREKLIELTQQKESMETINACLKEDAECSRLRSSARMEFQNIYIHVAVVGGLPKVPIYLPTRKKVAKMGIARTVGGVPEEIRIYPIHGPSSKDYSKWLPRELIVDSVEDVTETLLHEIAHIHQAQHDRVMDHEDSFIRAYIEVERAFVKLGLTDYLIVSKRFSGCPPGSKASLLKGVPRSTTV